MSLMGVPADQLATVVTTLMMHERPLSASMPESPLTLVRWRTPGLEAYRTLFRRVGEPWLWYSRLALDDAALAAKLAAPHAEIFAAVDGEGAEVGMVELDVSDPAETELVYFGLVPEATGRGHGRWLMAQTLDRAWRPGVARVRVNTCTLDHPAALPFYRRSGFVATRRTLETFPDPRILGLLPEDAAPQHPLLASGRWR